MHKRTWLHEIIDLLKEISAKLDNHCKRECSLQISDGQILEALERAKRRRGANIYDQ